MNKLIGFFLILTLFSCEKICSVTSIFCKKKATAKETIDFTQIDQFPQFKNCNPVADFDENKACFETTFHEKMNHQIQRLHLKTDQSIIDTIFVHFSITQKGTFVCKNIQLKDSLAETMPALSSEIQKIIQNFPAIHPAQKRGIPVTSSFTIPVIIKTP